MLLQERLQALAQLAGAVAVDDAHLAQVGDHRVVEKARHAVDRLVHRAADHVDLAEQALARLQVHVDADARLAGRLRRTGPPITRRSFTLARIRLPRTSTSACDAVDLDDRAFEAHAHRHLRADRPAAPPARPRRRSPADGCFRPSTMRSIAARASAFAAPDSPVFSTVPAARTRTPSRPALRTSPSADRSRCRCRGGPAAADRRASRSAAS